jgi:hypothetical protein
MKAWDRRLAVLVLVGTVAVAGSPAVSESEAWAASAGTGRTGRRPAHTEPGGLGILPAILSFFNRLVEKAIAVVTTTPAPDGPDTSSTPQGGSGDNGAGIDPNGF